MLVPGPAVYPSAGIWPSFSPALDSGGAAPRRRPLLDEDEAIALALALLS
jgi:hypothetical protein